MTKLALFVIIYEIFAIEMSKKFDLDSYNGTRLNANKPVKSPYTTFYLMVVVLLALAVTAYGILANQIKIQKCNLENEG